MNEEPIRTFEIWCWNHGRDRPVAREAFEQDGLTYVAYSSGGGYQQVYGRVFRTPEACLNAQICDTQNDLWRYQEKLTRLEAQRARMEAA